MFLYDMAFVHADGNDNTAEVGNINKPFATLQEAIIAVESTDFPVIQIMSDLTLITSVATPIDKDIIINLYNGVTINFTNTVDSSSLFTLRKNITITSNGSAKFVCESGTYLSSFATLNIANATNTTNTTLKLQNINIIHHINSKFSFNSTIICNDKSILQMNNCYIQTNSNSTDNSVSCVNFEVYYAHILELVDTKLVLINYANGGISRHI